jgi:hypothetical protein
MKNIARKKKNNNVINIADNPKFARQTLTELEFDRINRQSYLEKGILIVPAPIKQSGYTIKDGADKYIFVKENLTAAEKNEVILWGFAVFDGS